MNKHLSVLLGETSQQAVKAIFLLLWVYMIELRSGRLIYYSKKVLHHLIFTKFLSNVLNKYTKHIFKI